jgi:hypothetical protein
VYHSALSSSDVTDLYNGQLSTVPTYLYPLQEGDGTTIYEVGSTGNDGTLTNATLVDAWANRTNVVKDHCIEYGGRVDSGIFVPGNLVGSNAANGSAKTLSAGKFGNPYSRLNTNPFLAAELNGLGMETAYEVTDDRQSVSPTDTKFSRTDSDGDDRFTTFSDALTGSDLTDMESYTE